MRNYIRVGQWRLVNSVWDDGAVSISKDSRIVWSWDMPLWFVNLYNRVVR